MALFNGNGLMISSSVASAEGSISGGCEYERDGSGDEISSSSGSLVSFGSFVSVGPGVIISWEGSENSDGLGYT